MNHILNITIPSVFRRAIPLIAIACLIGCKKNVSGPPTMNGGGGMKMPPAEVSVLTISSESVSMTVQLPGRVNAVRDAEVRARVSGILLKRFFQEGADVKEGDLLFQIDPAPLQASYESAKASTVKAEAVLKQIQTKAQRYQALAKINAVSAQDEVDVLSSQAQAGAELSAAKAALETASLNLGYTKVTAPISGRIGKAHVTEGALVSSTDATQLAVIRQLDPIYVDFNASSAELMKLRRSIVANKYLKLASGQANVSLVMEDETTYEHQGQLVFSDVSVNEGTGSLVLRTQFPNPDKWLLPGMFVRGFVGMAINEQAITIPQRAVSRDGSGEVSTLVVSANNVVESRPIKVSSTHGNKWIVTSGLKAGERVVMEGSQKTHPGATVACVAFGATNAPNAAPAPSANGNNQKTQE